MSQGKKRKPLSWRPPRTPDRSARHCAALHGQTSGRRTGGVFNMKKQSAAPGRHFIICPSLIFMALEKPPNKNREFTTSLANLCTSSLQRAQTEAVIVSANVSSPITPRYISIFLCISSSQISNSHLLFGADALSHC